MKALKIVLWGSFILFLHSSILGIPFADMHTCELPNGDKVKIRTSRNWYLLKGLNPHGSSWGDMQRNVWYVAKEGFKFSIDSEGEDECDNYNVFGDLIYLFGEGLFLKSNNELVRPSIPSHDNFPMLGGFGWRHTAKEELEVSSLPSNTEYEQSKRMEFYDRIDKQRRKQYGLDDSLKFSNRFFYGKFGNELWEEYGFELVQENRRQSAGDCSILALKESHSSLDNEPPKVIQPVQIAAVWQSHSTDNGKTWSKPIITKNAKLFVIGKSIKEQPGVAKDKGILKNIGWF